MKASVKRNPNKLLGKAIKIAAEAFENKTDLGGVPYIMHCIFVMREMPKDDIELNIIAVLHDLIEDTDWEISDLAAYGYSDRVLDALILLTHDDESYDDYIKNIATNPDATKVKMADLRHNSDIHRMKGLREKDFARLEKYHRSYDYLRSKLNA